MIPSSQSRRSSPQGATRTAAPADHGIVPALDAREAKEEASDAIRLTEAPNLDATLDVVLPPFGYVDFQGATHHRFGPIGLGWQVYGDLTATGVYSKLGCHRGPGPTVEGESAPLKIEFHDEQRTLAHVSGVVLDPAGNPLAEQVITVTFGGLEPGKYELTIRLHGGNAVLHQRAVDVTGDIDPGTIDLKGLTALCHLRLVGAGGTLIRDSYVSVTDPASGVTMNSSARVDDRGRASLRVPANLGAVVVQRSDVGSAEVPSSWFVPVEVEGELERRTLVL